MKCSRLKIDHVHILIIIFIFRRESKCCSCERIFLRPIDAVYDSSVNKPDQLRWIMIDISWDLLSDWSRSLFCLYVCASAYFFFLTEMKIEFFYLALTIWIFLVRKVLFQVLVFDFITHTLMIGTQNKVQLFVALLCI